MVLIEAKVAAARTRAALAYANIDVKRSGDRIGISSATMARIVSPSNPRGASIEELWQIADACKVPRWFMEQGFDAPASTELEDQVAEHHERLARIEETEGDMQAALERINRWLDALRTGTGADIPPPLLEAGDPPSLAEGAGPPSA